LKCDETKPACTQCSRRNATCPGYKAQSLVWSTKHEKLLVPVAPTDVPTLASRPTLSDDPSSSSTSASQTENAADESGLKFSPNNHEENIPINSPSNNRSSTAVTNFQDSNTSTDSLSAIRQQLHRSTVPEFLLHLPTMLVEYYFSYVCQIFSSFDGTMNPFRSTVGKLWDGSAPIYYAIQSMAAAYLSNHFPRMSPVGIQMQRETYRCLYQAQQGGRDNFEDLDKTLLTVLLVGQTTAVCRLLFSFS
jgi:hypothetical protein